MCLSGLGGGLEGLEVFAKVRFGLGLQLWRASFQGPGSWKKVNWGEDLIQVFLLVTMDRLVDSP